MSRADLDAQRALVDALVGVARGYGNSELLRPGIEEVLAAQAPVQGDLTYEQIFQRGRLAALEDYKDSFKEQAPVQGDPVANDAEDAARYRWLCEFKEWPDDVENALDIFGKNIIDIAIDAARKAAKP